MKSTGRRKSLDLVAAEEHIGLKTNKKIREWTA